MASADPASVGSRRVEPRKRKRPPSDTRRRAARAIAHAEATAEEIHTTARERQHTRAEGEANLAASLDTDLTHLYEDYRGDRRDIYAAGIPEGSGYRSKTSRVGRGE